MAGAGYGRPSRIWKPTEVPPLRDRPFEADEHDAARVDYLCGLWKEQDNFWRRRDRQVEENIRMLLGQQWIVWSELRQRYIDVSETLSDDERKWRHMPVLNRILQWWILMKARMTENPPVFSVQPGPDQKDTQAAEVADALLKWLWRETAAIQMIDRLASWCIPSGRVHLKSVLNPNKGEFLSNRGPAILQLVDANGDPVGGVENPIQRYVDDVPYGEDFKPAARLVPEGDDYGYEELEDAPQLMLREGMIELELVTCLEVRSDWNNRPWHQKRLHMQRSLLPPEDVYERWGIECEPDTFAADDEGTNILWRLQHGDGLWGAAEGRGGLGTGVDETRSRGFVTLYEGWWAPSTRFQGMEEMPGPQGSPGGRLLQVTAGGKVLRDGPRTARFKHVSPIRCFDFLNLPGRPQGSSAQEALNGPSRTRNRLHGQMHANATLNGNPIQVRDRDAGIEEGTVTNRPGVVIEVSRAGLNGAPPIEFIAAPPLGDDVYETADRLKVEIDDIGLIRGTEATPPSADPSGKLVQELRINSDRPVGQTLRDWVQEFARLEEDWLAYIPVWLDQEKVIQIAGEDNITRTVTVLPELFADASLSVEPSIESMLPESRGERQMRVERFYQNGIYGMPGTPIAIQKFLDEARFPHMAKATRLGGVDRVMAEHNVGKLLQGVPAAQIPLLEPYDFEMHLWVLDQFMKGPDYLRLDIPRQVEFVTHRNNLKMALLAKMSSDAMLAEYAAAATGMVAPGAGGGSPSAGVGASPAAAGMGAPPTGSPAGQLPRTSSAVA